MAVDTRIKKRPLKNAVKFTFYVLYSKYTKFPILFLLDLSYFFAFIPCANFVLRYLRPIIFRTTKINYRKRMKPKETKSKRAKERENIFFQK